MSPGSRESRTLWRAVALLFALSVVTLRLGMAGCSPAFFGSTKAGGGFNRAQQASPPGANAPAAPAPRPLRDPAFLPPTKAGGGFYAAPTPAAETAEPQRPRPRLEEGSPYPGARRTEAVPQAPDPDER